eukprot:TRINITY_DN928_c0_g1_i2.p1 TRINITY_DN928_c0_g1~~TRINITY_DN928_c0_g1_i2.p1  ORF type:complete len:103 (-),score=4.71 TRINITY_DN928_c0_g1_i2:153-461(-)
MDVDAVLTLECAGVGLGEQPLRSASSSSSFRSYNRSKNKLVIFFCVLAILNHITPPVELNVSDNWQKVVIIVLVYARVDHSGCEKQLQTISTINVCPTWPQT